MNDQGSNVGGPRFQVLLIEADEAYMHPLIQSFEPGEDWIYCYIDDLVMAP
jgi:hypothetical protein